MNESGGQIKVSPDGGLLRQSSTRADAWRYTFADGETADVPGAC